MGTREDRWMACYNEVKAFKERNGVLPTEKNDFQFEASGSARNWVRRELTKVAEGRQPKERVELLAEIGIQGKNSTWNDRWMVSYNEVKAFRDKTGRLPTSRYSFKLSTGAESKGWIHAEVNKLNKGIQSEERTRLLAAIGIETKRSGALQDEECWQACYDEVKEYKEQNGCLPLYSRSFALKAGLSSQGWIRSEREKMSKDKQSEEHVKLLNDLGIYAPTQNHEFEWKIQYNEIKKYKEVTGTLPTAANDFVFSSGKSAYSWMKEELNKSCKGLLSDECSKLLAELGATVSLDSRTERWWANYRELKKYYMEHNKLPVSAEDDFRLKTRNTARAWIFSERTCIKKGTRTEEQIKLLAEIGIVAPRKRNN